MDIATLKNNIWQKIREHQAAGGQVRSGEMSSNFGGQRGYSTYQLDLPVCLLGLMLKDAVKGERIEETAARVLGISNGDAADLESGFECWGGNGPFYLLGREIAQQLLSEEEIQRQK